MSTVVNQYIVPLDHQKNITKVDLNQALDKVYDYLAEMEFNLACERHYQLLYHGIKTRDKIIYDNGIENRLYADFDQIDWNIEIIPISFEVVDWYKDSGKSPSKTLIPTGISYRTKEATKDSFHIQYFENQGFIGDEEMFFNHLYDDTIPIEWNEQGDWRWHLDECPHCTRNLRQDFIETITRLFKQNTSSQYQKKLFPTHQTRFNCKSCGQHLNINQITDRIVLGYFSIWVQVDYKYVSEICKILEQELNCEMAIETYWHI